jgi:hypothetical protein
MGALMHGVLEGLGPLEGAGLWLAALLAPGRIATALPEARRARLERALDAAGIAAPAAPVAPDGPPCALALVEAGAEGAEAARRAAAAHPAGVLAQTGGDRIGADRIGEAPSLVLGPVRILLPWAGCDPRLLALARSADAPALRALAGIVARMPAGGRDGAGEDGDAALIRLGYVLAQRTRRAEAAEAALRRVRAERDEARARIRALEASTSWRITGPLRGAARAARGRRD